jgi:hypothetical protein
MQKAACAHALLHSLRDAGRYNLFVPCALQHLFRPGTRSETARNLAVSPEQLNKRNATFLSQKKRRKHRLSFYDVLRSPFSTVLERLRQRFAMLGEFRNYVQEFWMKIERAAILLTRPFSARKRTRRCAGSPTTT